MKGFRKLSNFTDSLFFKSSFWVKCFGNSWSIGNLSWLRVCRGALTQGRIETKSPHLWVRTACLPCLPNWSPQSYCFSIKSDINPRNACQGQSCAACPRTESEEPVSLNLPWEVKWYQPMSYICKEFSFILTYALRNVKCNSNSWDKKFPPQWAWRYKRDNRLSLRYFSNVTALQTSPHVLY